MRGFASPRVLERSGAFEEHTLARNLELYRHGVCTEGVMSHDTDRARGTMLLIACGIAQAVIIIALL